MQDELQHYGIDWDGPSAVDNDHTVEVPAVFCPLQRQELDVLQSFLSIHLTNATTLVFLCMQLQELLWSIALMEFNYENRAISFRTLFKYFSMKYIQPLTIGARFWFIA